MYRYLIRSIRLLLFLLPALVPPVMYGLLTLRLDVQCRALAGANDIGEDVGLRALVTREHVIQVVEKFWLLAVIGFLLFMQHDLIFRSRWFEPRDRPPNRLFVLMWTAGLAMAFRKPTIHVPFMQQLIDGALVYAVVEILFYYEPSFQDSRDHFEVLEQSEKRNEIDIDDGCTEMGKLEATLRRPWTWTIRSTLSWKKHDAGTETQKQE